MFDVPELVPLVFAYLEHHHLAQCALVSKDWHSAVMPVLWRTIPDFFSLEQELKFRDLVHEDYYYCHRAIHDPDEEDLSATCACEPVLAIESTKEVSSSSLQLPIAGTTLMKYGHWIHNIPEMNRFVYILQPSMVNSNNNSGLEMQRYASIKYDMVRHFLERFPNVQSQKLRIHKGYVCKVYTSCLGQERFLDYLIERVLPTVRELVLDDLFNITDLRRILSASAKSLTHLHVNVWGILRNTALGVVPATVDDIPFKATLSSLTISMMDKYQPVEFWAGFWRGCINVTSLTVYIVIPGLIEALKRDVAEHLPNLHTLCLGHRFLTYGTSEVLRFSDEDMAVVFGAVTAGSDRGWRVINTDETVTLGPSSMSVLVQQHCSTLERLSCWPTYESTFLIDLLASCARMEVLEFFCSSARRSETPVAPITVQQLIDWDEDTDAYRPWACERTLQTLDIQITGLDPNKDEWALHSKMYGRLARLTQLRELKLEVVQGPQRTGLAMSLELGLARLSGLKKLEVLKICGVTHFDTERKDVEWMVENWPRLRWIQGLAKDEDKWLRNFLKCRNS
ncbi:hypothetical protein BGZ92_007104 [Podila epicladia]|nr:hypothetical protein BGZ92_007104 [Podila epicladia]